MTAASNGGLNQDAAIWLGCLDRIIACAQAIAETARIKAAEGAHAKLLAACLLARSISTAHAVGRLIGLGHVVEARMLARSIFENMFYLCRLAQDGSAFAREMQADDVYYRAARGQTLLEEKQAREAMGEESQSRIRAIINGLRKRSPNAKPLKPQNVITGDDISAAYVYYLLGGCIAANDAFGKTTGGERLDGLVAEYHEIAARTLPASAENRGS